ncbi:MAG: hypothetical protein AAGF07_01730 [Patescibacteria group bacterium]
MTEQPNKNWNRCKILETDITESDRPYLNYLAEAVEPISMQLWSEFANIEIEFLEELISKYNITTVENKNGVVKIVPISINTSNIKSANKDIAKNLLEKWRSRKYSE